MRPLVSLDMSSDFKAHFFKSCAGRKFTHLSLPLPDIETYEAVGGGRYYKTPVGDLPSVTTVLSFTEDKSWMKEWYDRVGEEKAKAISEEGAARGTYVHSLIERYLKNSSIDKSDHPPSYYWMFKRVQSFLNRIDNIRCQEAAVFSKKYKIAGKLDCAADFDGVPSIIDFKNYSKPKDKAMLQGAFIQATIYSICLEECFSYLNIPGDAPKFEQVVIIFASETDKSGVLVDSRENYLAAALDRIARYHAARS